jgi:hypothetical protein
MKIDTNLLKKKFPKFMVHPVKSRPPCNKNGFSSQIRNSVEENTSPDGNVTVSTLSLMPTTMEAGNLLVCQAGNPRIPDSTLEDAWKLQIHCKETTLLFYYLHFPCSFSTFQSSFRFFLDFLKHNYIRKSEFLCVLKQDGKRAYFYKVFHNLAISSTL